MYQEDLKFLQSLGAVNSSNIIESIDCFLRLNKVAKVNKCSKDLKDNIYYFKYMIAKWLYRKKYCIAARYIYSSSAIICKNCRGTGKFFNTVTLIERSCKKCNGFGEHKNIFLAMKFEIKNKSFIWHIPKDIADKYNFTENHIDIIPEHAIEKKKYKFKEVYKIILG